MPRPLPAKKVEKNGTGLKTDGVDEEDQAQDVDDFGDHEVLGVPSTEEETYEKNRRDADGNAVPRWDVKVRVTKTGDAWGLTIDRTGNERMLCSR